MKTAIEPSAVDVSFRILADNGHSVYRLKRDSFKRDLFDLRAKKDGQTLYVAVTNWPDVFARMMDLLNSATAYDLAKQADTAVWVHLVEPIGDDFTIRGWTIEPKDF